MHLTFRDPSSTVSHFQSWLRHQQLPWPLANAGTEVIALTHAFHYSVCARLDSSGHSVEYVCKHYMRYNDINLVSAILLGWDKINQWQDKEL